MRRCVAGLSIQALRVPDPPNPTVAPAPPIGGRLMVVETRPQDMRKGLTCARSLHMGHHLPNVIQNHIQSKSGHTKVKISKKVREHSL